MSEFRKNLSNLVNAGFTYIYIPSYEERRVINEINNTLYKDNSVKIGRKLFVWTQTNGLMNITPGDKDNNKKDTRDAVKALEEICSDNDPALYIFNDIHVFFGGDRGTHPDYLLIRKLRDIISLLQSKRKTIVFLSPKLVIPCDMEKEITVLDFDLPDMEDMINLLDDLSGGLNPSQIQLTSDEKKQLASSALGLTLQEAENAFCKAIVDLRGLNINAQSIIHEEKNQVVKKTGVLEFVKSDLSIDDIGGLENLKKWLIKRKGTWTEKARKYNLPAPKGVLITGVPGCGKSLTAKAMSSIWGLPLLKLDMGKIFGGLVGSSEENMRKAISTAEAIAPSILWVDEIEKGLSGVKSSGDSGTSARVFGTFLTWLQEKTKPVFVIATANDISALPPELLRKGRFDEIFFVDLPTFEERKKIFELHINKRIKDSDIQHEVAATDDVLNNLASMSAGYVGAEIEQITVAALYEAYYLDRGLRESDLEKAVKETVSISTTQKEQILSLREWAENRAVLATAKEDREPDTSEGSDDIGHQGGRIVNFDL